MCRTCGCSDDAQVTLTDLETGVSMPLSADHSSHKHTHAHSHSDDHSHDHDHSHEHDHDHMLGHGHMAVPTHHHATVISLEEKVLAKNSLLAERNRGWLAGRGVLAVNLISSPGSGKTTLLERTINDLGSEFGISVIEGDQATLHDAQRIAATGSKVVQINTGAGCHLEAAMTARGFQQLDPPLGSLVMIENVGNLVCPALFDLGERAKVVIMSVTEGDDKPVKYPHAFRASRLMILNKIDLLPYVPFDVDRCLAFARQVNPRLTILQVSALRGEGLAQWYDWLRQERNRREPL